MVRGWRHADLVAPGENADILARRYGVPTDALVKANGLASASQVQPGGRVVIPVYNARWLPRGAIAAAPRRHAQAEDAAALLRARLGPQIGQPECREIEKAAPPQAGCEAARPLKISAPKAAGASAPKPRPATCES